MIYLETDESPQEIQIIIIWIILSLLKKRHYISFQHREPKLTISVYIHVALKCANKSHNFHQKYLLLLYLMFKILSELPGVVI